ncbi:MAG: DUF2934 domain-containing protein, partial [Devosia sp.]
HREVPTMPFSDADIRERARALWEQSGRPEGQDFEIWIEAERQLIAEDQQQFQEPTAPEPAPVDVAPAEAAPAEAAPIVDQAEVAAQPLPDEEVTDEETPAPHTPAVDLSYLRFGSGFGSDDQPFH